MNDRDPDPLELIRQADPAPRESTPTSMSSLGRSIRNQVAEKMIAEQPRNRGRLLARVALAIAVAVASASVAAWAITRTGNSERLAVTVIQDVSRTSVICYEAASLQSTAIVVASPTSLDASACTPLWISESFKIPSPGDEAVPPLVACVNTEGVLAVFPTSNNSDVCAELVLAHREPSAIEQPLGGVDTRSRR